MIGTTLGHYRVEARLGEGGMGVVYRAHDIRLNRPVAIKVLPPDLISDEGRRLRFQREAQAAAALNHPNICTVYAVEEHDGTAFLVMELLEGVTLRERIGRRPMALKELLPIAIQVGEALQAAHERGVLHRDLKPDNVFITKQGPAKVLDFGLAKILHAAADATEAQSRLETISRELTVQGKVFGTVAYMSPEQARGEQMTSHSDLFSFGVVLYEMATGRQPFRGKSDVEILASILKEEAPPLHTGTDEAQPELERIIAKALEKDPQDRYHHADDMVTDLRRLKRAKDSGGHAVITPAGTVVAAPRAWRTLLAGLRRWRWLTAGIAVAAVAAGGLTVWRARHASTGFMPGDRILVADIENGTLRPDLAALRAVVHSMLPSGVVSFVGPGDLEGLEKEMAAGTMPLIDASLADQLCRSGECAGHLTGRIEAQDGGYRIELRAQRTGAARPAIVRSGVAPSDADILETIYRLAGSLRQRLGENPGRLAFPPPPGTRSLAAYQTQIASFEVEDNFAAIAVLKRALQQDPDYITPYLQIGTHYSNLGDWREYRRWVEEARKRSAGSPELERLVIESAYLETHYRFDEDIETLRSGQQLYPLLELWYDWLGWDYTYIFEDPVSAEAAHRKAYELAPHPILLQNLAHRLHLLGKPEAIDALVAEHLSKGGKERDIEEVRLRVAILTGNLEVIRGFVDRMIAQPGEKRLAALKLWGNHLLATGRLREARPVLADAARAAGEARQVEVRFIEALLQVWLEGRSGGHVSLSRDEIVPADKTFYHVPRLATMAVEIGLAEPLATLIREHEADLRGSPSRFVKEELLFARGCVLLIQGRAGEAARILEPLARNSIILRRHHVLARAYESLGRWRESAAQYEEVLRFPHRGEYLVNPALWVLDQFRAAGTFERLGDAARARQLYGQFLADWKDADPDIPEVIEAHQRLQALGG